MSLRDAFQSIASTILAMVMDQEGVPYSRKVSEFWPEFGKNGKQDVTIMNVVLHQVRYEKLAPVLRKIAHLQAGLPYTDQVVTKEDVADWRRMSTYFENATPVWTPGTETGYHALTFGLVSSLLEISAPRKRPDKALQAKRLEE